MSDAIQEFLEFDEQLAKEGGLWSAAKDVGQKAGKSFASSMGSGLGQLGAGALMTAGAYGASKAISAASAAINRSRGYKKMMEVHPDLSDRDEEQVKGMYNLLHKTSPTMAMNPYVAGGFVRKTEHASQYVDPKMVTDLASAEANIQRSSLGGVGEPMRLAGQMMGMMPGAKPE